MPDFVLALDQGTTSSRAIVFDSDARIRGIEQLEYPQLYPQSGWVEHDPEEIWQSQVTAARRVVDRCGLRASDLAGIGITNQRETVILWERAGGRPVANAIVWQDRRTAPLCTALREEGCEELVRRATGLTLDPYFSATKIRWLLDNTPGLRERAEKGEIAFGTVDSFLLWRLTDGRIHATDPSNACRTLLFNIRTGEWDEELLRLFRIPRAILPVVQPSCHSFGAASALVLGFEAPIGGVAGDQQAALFGQACLQPGMAKNTYGTGSFLLMNTGAGIRESTAGLLTTVAWDLGREPSAAFAPVYALEGSIFVTGAAVQWLRDELGIIGSAAEVESLAASVPDTGGVAFVPAFVGLGAPYWDPEARGALLGLTRGTGRAHIARAALDAACHQSCDVLEVMCAEGGFELPELRVDGGMSVNNTLMQMQADLLGVPVVRPAASETTALGAACLAGITAGLWNSAEAVAANWRRDREFQPQISRDERLARRAAWRSAVTRVRSTSPFGTG